MTSDIDLQETKHASALLDRAEELCKEYFRSLSTQFNNTIIENTDSFLASDRRAIIEISLNSLIHTDTKRSLLWFFTQHMNLGDAALEHLLSNRKTPYSDTGQARESALHRALNETLSAYKNEFATELFALELRFRSLRKHAVQHSSNSEPWTPTYAYSTFRLWLNDMGLFDKFEFELIRFFDQSFCESYATFLASLNALFSDAEVLPATFSSHRVAQPHEPLFEKFDGEVKSLYADAQWVITKTHRQPIASSKTHQNTTPISEAAHNESIENPTSAKASINTAERSLNPIVTSRMEQITAGDRLPRDDDPLAEIDRGTILDLLDNANNWQRRKVVSFDRDTHEYLLSGKNTLEHRSENELIELYQAQKLQILAPSKAQKGIYSRIKERLQKRKSSPPKDPQSTAGKQKSVEETSN